MATKDSFNIRYYNGLDVYHWKTDNRPLMDLKDGLDKAADVADLGLAYAKIAGIAAGVTLRGYAGPNRVIAKSVYTAMSITLSRSAAVQTLSIGGTTTPVVGVGLTPFVVNVAAAGTGLYNCYTLQARVADASSTVPFYQPTNPETSTNDSVGTETTMGVVEYELKSNLASGTVSYPAVDAGWFGVMNIVTTDATTAITTGAEVTLLNYMEEGDVGTGGGITTTHMFETEEVVLAAASAEVGPFTIPTNAGFIFIDGQVQYPGAWAGDNTTITGTNAGYASGRAGSVANNGDLSYITAADTLPAGTRVWLMTLAAGFFDTQLPAGGTTGQVLVKMSNVSYDADWGTVYLVPGGGSIGQVLAKQSGADGDFIWQSGSVVPGGGADGEVLTWNTGSYDWAPAPIALPAGGTAGQILKKDSATDGDASWEDRYPASPSIGSVLTVKSTGPTVTSWVPGLAQPLCECYFTYSTSLFGSSQGYGLIPINTTPYTSGRIFVPELMEYRSVPTAGSTSPIILTTTTYAANTAYYVFGYWDAGTSTIKIEYTSPVQWGLGGSEGLCVGYTIDQYTGMAVKAIQNMVAGGIVADRTRFLLGAFTTTASGSITYSGTGFGVRGYYNRNTYTSHELKKSTSDITFLGTRTPVTVTSTVADSYTNFFSLDRIVMWPGEGFTEQLFCPHLTITRANSATGFVQFPLLGAGGSASGISFLGGPLQMADGPTYDIATGTTNTSFNYTTNGYIDFGVGLQSGATRNQPMNCSTVKPNPFLYIHLDAIGSGKSCTANMPVGVEYKFRFLPSRALGDYSR